jgi:CheY-like chemotaxis protein
MPQKDGLEVLKEIRESKNNAQTPVIMLSSKDYDQDKKSAYALGATAFLSKPPMKQQLQDKLNQFLN